MASAKTPFKTHMKLMHKDDVAVLAVSVYQIRHRVAGGGEAQNYSGCSPGLAIPN